jgi:hypothetical protein
MKKFLSFISIFLVLGTMAFADVSVKKLSDGKVEVTFFYGNPRAQEVVIAGDFTNWQAGALPMTKGDKGWTYVTTVAAGTVMKYKFISDGNWTPDLKAPDTVDDGFGGLNGLVDVDALVAASAGATPAADTVAAKKANLKFSTWSMIGTQAKWGSDNEIASAGVGAKSYVKVSGDALPDMPIYIEIALFENDGFDNLYNKGTTDWADGFKNILVDTVFDPIYYYGGQGSAKTYLGHFKAGFNTPYVNYVTGYKYAKLPPHTNVNWTTVDKEWEAGWGSVGGYSQFEFAPTFKKLLADTGVEVNAVLAPNRTADRQGLQYGFYGYSTAKFNIADFSQYVDFQYNGAFGKTWSTFYNGTSDIMEDDFILGYQGVFGPISVKANGLYNRWGSTDNGDGTKTTYSPSTSDVGMVDDADQVIVDNAAANVNITFSNDMISTMLGYRMRGKQASMMYVEQGADGHTDISDQLGGLNTQRIFADVSGTFVEKAVTVGVAPYVDMILNGDNAFASYNNKKTLDVYAKPYFTVDLKPLADFAAKVDGYAKMHYYTTEEDAVTRGTASNQFYFAEAGVKYDMTFDSEIAKELTVVYAIDNGDTSYLFNTVTADVAFAHDITAQAGVGLRTKNTGITADPASPFGFFVGAKKKLTVLAKPTAYLQYMYGMDPYNSFGDGPTAYNLDGYTFDAGVGDYNGNAAIRCGLQWDL